MKICEIAKELSLEISTDNDGINNEAIGAYVGDLLSWVMGNLQSGNIWITVQGHLNIVAVASLNEASCIIVAEGAKAQDVTIKKANSENIPILYTDKSCYQISKELAMLGI